VKRCAARRSRQDLLSLLLGVIASHRDPSEVEKVEDHETSDLLLTHADPFASSA
jgi:hypothetical protein